MYCKCTLRLTHHTYLNLNECRAVVPLVQRWLRLVQEIRSQGERASLCCVNYNDTGIRQETDPILLLLKEALSITWWHGLGWKLVTGNGFDTGQENNKMSRKTKWCHRWFQLWQDSQQDDIGNFSRKTEECITQADTMNLLGIFYMGSKCVRRVIYFFKFLFNMHL